jgi:hypothetical protein
MIWQGLVPIMRGKIDGTDKVDLLKRSRWTLAFLFEGRDEKPDETVG